jgi:hypothetical protein
VGRTATSSASLLLGQQSGHPQQRRLATSACGLSTVRHQRRHRQRRRRCRRLRRPADRIRFAFHPINKQPAQPAAMTLFSTLPPRAHLATRRTLTATATVTRQTGTVQMGSCRPSSHSRGPTDQRQAHQSPHDPHLHLRSCLSRHRHSPLREQLPHSRLQGRARQQQAALMRLLLRRLFHGRLLGLAEPASHRRQPHRRRRVPL